MGSQTIQTGRFDNLLSRLLGISGVEKVAGDLSPEISAVLTLECDRPEWGYLADVKHMGAGFSQAALAGNPTYARIRNPLNSGVLAVVRLTCSFTTTVPVRELIGTATTDRANLKQTFPTDSRWRVGTGGTLICSSDNAASAGSTCGYIDLLANTQQPEVHTYVLAPGSHIDIGTDTVNVLGAFTFNWTERPLLPYELRQ